MSRKTLSVRELRNVLSAVDKALILSYKEEVAGSSPATPSLRSPRGGQTLPRRSRFSRQAGRSFQAWDRGELRLGELLNRVNMEGTFWYVYMLRSQADRAVRHAAIRESPGVLKVQEPYMRAGGYSREELR